MEVFVTLGAEEVALLAAAGENAVLHRPLSIVNCLPAAEGLAIEQRGELHRALLQAGAFICFVAGDPQGVEHAALDVLLIDRVVPDVIAVPQRGVEDLALTEGAAPGDGVVAILALALTLHGLGVHAEDDVDAVAVVVPELVDLVLDRPLGVEVERRGVARILDVDGDVLVPGMAVEAAADHVPVRLPVLVGVGGAVEAGEGMAFLDPVDEIVAVGLAEAKLLLVAGGVEGDAVVLLQPLRVDLVGVVGGGDLEVARVEADLGEHLVSGRDRTVTEAGGVGDEENLLRLDLLDPDVLEGNLHGPAAVKLQGDQPGAVDLGVLLGIARGHETVEAQGDVVADRPDLVAVPALAVEMQEAFEELRPVILRRVEHAAAFLIVEAAVEAIADVSLVA